MRSHWLEQALASEADVAATLEGNDRADICIVGGGYAGLWAALEMKRAEPSMDVALVEADICGGGASGRNAGYLVDLWVKFPMMKQMFGTDEALRLNGSGLAISNPPWGLEEELRELLPWLAKLLGQSEGGWRLDWLIEEA